MKTSELTGAALALWVARAIGQEATISLNDRCFMLEGGVKAYWFKPHEDWSQGGPLLEKHRIETSPTYAFDGVTVTGWSAMMFNDTNSPHLPAYDVGPTLLVAAMRVLVASVYGDTVEDAPC